MLSSLPRLQTLSKGIGHTPVILYSRANIQSLEDLDYLINIDYGWFFYILYFNILFVKIGAHLSNLCGEQIVS